MVQQVFLQQEDGEPPVEIVRFNPSSGKIWEDSTDSYFEEQVTQLCSTLHELCPDPATTEEQLHDKLRVLYLPDPDDDEAKGESWLSYLKQAAADLAGKSNFAINLYEAWWSYNVASIKLEHIANAKTVREGMTSADEHVRKALKLRKAQPLLSKVRRPVNLLVNFLVERLIEDERGTIALALYGKAVQGDVGAILAATRAYNPKRAIHRSEANINEKRVNIEINPDSMSSEEMQVRIRRLRKEAGEEALDKMEWKKEAKDVG